MASSTSLRQASRLVQSNRSHLAPSRIRQYSQSTTAHALLSSRTSPFSRRSPIRSQYVSHQSRNLSWWGSGASTSPSPQSQAATPSSNLDISEPSDLQNIIAPDRSFRASSNISSAELEAHASSTPNPLEPQFLEDAQQAIAAPHFAEPDTLPSNLEDLPERIGYLKEDCGLDFGWGPTSTVQYLLEHLHITGGYSWTVSIVLLGCAVRAIVFPALIGAAKQTQKMRDLKDIVTPIQAEYTAAKEKGDQTKMGQAAQRLMAVRKEFGVRFWKVFLPPLLQIPFGFGCWRLLRNAATLPVPGFITESWLWTTDLSFSDPYYIAPFISGFLIWATMRINRRVNATPQTESLMVLLMKFLPVITFGFMSFQPGAVQLYFVASSAVGLVSALILQQSLVRKFFDMPPVNPVASTQIPKYLAPVVSKLRGGAPATQKAPITPRPLVPKAIGGLHRNSRAERMAEAERAAQLAQQNAENARSKTDDAVDGVKNWWGKHAGQVRSAGSNIAGKFKSAAGGANKQVTSADAESYEFRIQEKLDRQRRERNEQSRRKG